MAAASIFELGYRRFEWKCDNLNVPSQKAVACFGFRFEGIFRQHLVSRGQNRDISWFSMLDKEWLEIRKAYEEWLKPENFTAAGAPKNPLRFFWGK